MARIIHAPQVEPRRKPPRGARIDWANPLTRELTFLAPLWEGGGGAVQDVVSQRVGTLQGSVGWDVSESGIAALFTQGGNDAIDFGDIERKTGSWSVMGMIRTPASLSTAGQILVARAIGGGGSYQQNYVLMAEYARSPKAFSIGTSADSYIRAYSTTVPQARTEYVVIGTFNATTYEYRIAVNGVVEATASGTGLPSTSSQVLTLGAGDGTDYAFNLDEQLLLAAVWDRALSDGEIARLGAEPFSLFTFGRRVLPAAAGGGLSIPVAMHYRKMAGVS